MYMFDEKTLKDIYENTKTVVVVGFSRDENKPGQQIPLYLKEKAGFNIVGVNPNAESEEINGIPVYHSIEEVPGYINPEIVEVFRNHNEIYETVKKIIASSKSVKYIVIQPQSNGETNPVEITRAIELGEKNGVKVIQGCLYAEHQRYLGLKQKEQI